MMLKRIKEFWETNPCGARYSGTLDLLDRSRYFNYPFIPMLLNDSNLQGKKVLEIGCGPGTDARYICRLGAEYVGGDLTGVATRLTHSLEIPNIIQFSAEDLPFRTTSFDVVYSWGVLHHTPNTEKSFSEIHRVLKPEGRFIGMLYSKYSIIGLIAEMFGGLSKNTEGEDNLLTKAFSKKEITTFMEGRFGNLILTNKSASVLRFGKVVGYLISSLPDTFGWFTIIRGTKI
jgi:SAM-dependent methyltransferase